ncbi:MAG TPA: ABC transporter substrate-binding protein [Chloroflexota bacterium]|nr:ABC transporter substrate-binding protein [Chloroflexota bacterium]
MCSVKRRAAAALLLSLVVVACAPAPPPAAPSAGAASGTPPTVGAATAPAASAAPTEAAAPAVGPAPATQVKVGTIAAINDAGLYLALDRGYFAAEGLDVELVPFRASADMIPLMGNGQLDVGSGAAIPSIFNAISRGVALRIVGDKGSYLGSCTPALVVRRSLADTVHTLDDLAGRKVAVVNLNVATHLDLVKGLEAAGVPLDRVEVVAIPFPEMNTALANGAVDAALLSEPFLTQGAEQGISSQLLCGEDLNPGRQYAMLTYAPHFVADERAAGERLMLAYLRGVRDYTDAMRKGIDRDAVIDVLVRYAPADPDLYRRMRPVDLDPDGRPNRASIAFDQATLLRLGAIQQPVDLDAVIDSSFVDYALARLGPYR